MVGTKSYIRFGGRFYNELQSNRLFKMWAVILQIGAVRTKTYCGSGVILLFLS